MELNMDMVEIMTNPALFKEMMEKYKRRQDSQKRANANYYNKHKEEISLKAKEKYRTIHPEIKQRGRPKKMVADGEVI